MRPSRAYAQQNRKLNRNNNTGHQNIRKTVHGTFQVYVGGVYLRTEKTLDKAIRLRDAERKRVFTETE